MSSDLERNVSLTFCGTEPMKRRRIRIGDPRPSYCGNGTTKSPTIATSRLDAICACPSPDFLLLQMKNFALLVFIWLEGL